ncbi:TPA: MetQ/NlpA family ABC transporter substrate-binding protein [Neisseria meningitidis]|uniref:Lipoprotein n=3 Tax=Neisseria meningitidis TaxID=487 RepID=Q9JPG4_NEIME|nr:MetQ/NlpA family ABC transporter substrate-binding protein [Neisseria meningitidis]EGC52313.1 D-methionine ABC transporter, periplasmic D-methionine-binding protein [Neisseria meningitidis OX99.30304]EOC21195.1 NLPA lipofamily protein [Neisseria meningitidis NM3147]EOC39057.1 NLPA lipofamily protein [Neisseria meningitidis 2005079]AAF42632.1 outer membrane lipoprotein GNA1946 [Neisseria meningitidis]AAF42639.1 outer membrane lipoprotein GNA1946 [Neisseria meningitidis]
MKTFFKTLSAAALALILAACGGQKDSAPAASASAAADNGAEKKEIVFGTTVGDFGDMVKEQIQAELEKKGYTVKLVEFTDYVRPNLALAEGELDINVFQHKPYLDDFKKEHNLDITEVFQVPTAPLGLYPGKLKSLEEVKDGSTVSAPNDPSNFARVLVMLDELGWIKLKDGINPLTASKADIAENLKNIKIVELEAAQLPRSRADVDFAVVNGNYAISSGMKLTEALFQEPSFAYVNWSAVKTADKDSQWLKDVTEAYNSDAFKAYAHKRFEGYKSPAAWNEGAAK